MKPVHGIHKHTGKTLCNKSTERTTTTTTRSRVTCDKCRDILREEENEHRCMECYGTGECPTCEGCGVIGDEEETCDECQGSGDCTDCQSFGMDPDHESIFDQ